MNEQNPSIPPRIPPVAPPEKVVQLGDDPAERIPITNFVAAIDAILRHPRRVIFQLRQPIAGKLIAQMLFVALGCSLVYGVLAGTFSGGTQLWAAPVKIAGGLMVSAMICGSQKLNV